MATPNLALTHVEQNPTAGYARVNELADGLDHAMNSSLTINFASDADLTLSTTGTVPQQWQNGTIVLTDTGVVLTTGRNVIVPTNERIYRVVNNTAQTLTVKTSAGTGIAVATSTGALLQCDGTNVIDALPGVGSGETNTASNVGTSGVGVFKQKSGVDFEFKKINTSTPSLVTITDDTGNDEIDIDVAIDIDDVTPTTTKGDIIVENGTNAVRLAVGTDGTTLVADSTQATGVKWAAGGSTDANAIHKTTAGEISTLTTVTVASGDFILIEDVSDSNNKKKILASDLLGAASLPVSDTTSIVAGSTDATKELRLEVDGLTTATTRVWTAQDTDLTVAGTDVNQTFSAAQRGNITTLTDGATITPNFNDSNFYTVTINGSRTLANPTNLTAGQSGVIYVNKTSAGDSLAYGTYWPITLDDFSGMATTETGAIYYSVIDSTHIDASTKYPVGP